MITNHFIKRDLARTALLSFWHLAMAISVIAADDIRVPPFILEPRTRQAMYLQAASEVNISCRATGVPIPTYTWLQNGSSINNTNIKTDLVTGELFIGSISETEEGIFQCHATNRFPNGPFATAVSEEVEIRVLLQDFKPDLPYFSNGTSLVVVRNNTAVLKCNFSAYTNGSRTFPVITWWLGDDGVQIVSGGRYSVLNEERTLRIANVQESDEGVYTCRSNNSLGTNKEQLYLNVTSVPIWVRPLEEVTVLEDEAAMFACIARSAVGESLPDTPVWYLNGNLLGTAYDPYKFIFNKEKTELSILHTHKDTDNICLQCYVSNSVGRIFANGCLRVISQIRLVSQPYQLTQSVSRGDIVHLTVIAISDASTNLTYSWIFRNKTYDDIGNPPPHVKVTPAKRTALIYTSELSDDEMKEITGTYRRVISNEYQTIHVDIIVTLENHGNFPSNMASPVVVTILLTASFAVLAIAAEYQFNR